ncbi:hypothetical protein A2818_01310 [Candidatus Nomurabacteria bacterium RIFCSPHIGHO2_01_FULL_40_12]|uniref:Uncharacterized protein n=1 Tax=Candidatus Nomurabacteria bacterium RIFCSPHIGHO2_01_FULL_40_12 TaxID=1801737 RepID=A0A1F6V0Y6_9BACT|nr:MAG: hypothetical protein A2818_01310 [Candidatus Nomurabacteria bacterium RIFCSPHIGHO2_01_FULL_40_12]
MLQQHTHTNDEHKHGEGHGNSSDNQHVISHHDHEFNLGHHSVHQGQLHHIQEAIKAMSGEQVRQLKTHSHSTEGGKLSYHQGGVDHHYKVFSHHGQLEVHKDHVH